MSLDKLIKCLELTRSDSDGEALNAIRKADTLRNSLGLTWGDLVRPQQPAARSPGPDQFDFSGFPEIEAMFIALGEVDLPDSTQEFIDGVEEFFTTRSYLTDKQHAALCKTYARFARGKRGWQ